jgi:hypothetical protein
MTRIERLLTKYTHNEKTCVHDGKFFCTTVGPMQQGESYYVFACEHHCGYFLNFDPAQFPSGVHYTPVPGQRSDGQEWKTMAPFAKEGTKLEEKK